MMAKCYFLLIPLLPLGLMCGSLPWMVDYLYRWALAPYRSFQAAQVERCSRSGTFFFSGAS